MILPHEFAPGLIRSYQGTHCAECGYVEADSIHAQDRPSVAFGLSVTADAEVIPGDLWGMP